MSGERAAISTDSRYQCKAPKWKPHKLGRILIPPPKARERTAAVCGAPAAAARRGQAFSDNSATLGIRTCCGWSFGHSRDPVVVPRCARPGHALPRLKFPQLRLLHERVTNHVANAHVRVLDTAVMGIVDDDRLVADLRQPAA